MIRGKRQCQHKRSDGLTVCQLHEPSRLAKERELSVLKKRPRGGEGGGDDDNDAGDGDEGESINANEVVDGMTTQKKHRISAIKRISGSQNRMFNGFSAPPDDPGVQGLPAAETETWNSFLHNPSLPCTVDIGCARGVLIKEMAERHEDKNFIGVEVRDKLVAEANSLLPTCIQTGRNNCRFVSANLLNEKHRTQLENGLRTLPNIERVSILFPDPWIKPKHRNRRIVQIPVIRSIASLLAPGGLFIIASDVDDMMADAKEKMGECADIFTPITASHPLVMENLQEVCAASADANVSAAAATTASAGADAGAGSNKRAIDDNGYVLFSPFRPLASEREQVCEMSWRRVYRLIYTRN